MIWWTDAASFYPVFNTHFLLLMYFGYVSWKIWKSTICRPDRRFEWKEVPIHMRWWSPHPLFHPLFLAYKGVKRRSGGREVFSSSSSPLVSSWISHSFVFDSFIPSAATVTSDQNQNQSHFTSKYRLRIWQVLNSYFHTTHDDLPIHIRSADHPGLWWSPWLRRTVSTHCYLFFSSDRTLSQVASQKE